MDPPKVPYSALIHDVILRGTSPIPNCDALSHGSRKLPLNLACVPWALND